MNPALDAHRSVLKQVIAEEEKEIEENYRGSLPHIVHEAKAAQEALKRSKKERSDRAPAEEGSAGSDDESSSESESSSDEDSDGEGDGGL